MIRAFAGLGCGARVPALYRPGSNQGSSLTGPTLSWADPLMNQAFIFKPNHWISVSLRHRATTKGRVSWSKTIRKSDHPGKQIRIDEFDEGELSSG